MSWWCGGLCPGAPAADMGAQLSQEGTVGAGAVTSQPTMADVIRERKKKSGSAALGTLRRRLAARRTDRQKQDSECSQSRWLLGVVSRWRVVEVWALRMELEGGAALRDLTRQAELAREPALPLSSQLGQGRRHRWWCDVQLVGAGYCIQAHKAILAARCTYFRELLARHPSNTWIVPLEGVGAALTREEMEMVVAALYGDTSPQSHSHTNSNTQLKWSCPADSEDCEDSAEHAVCRCNSLSRCSSGSHGNGSHGAGNHSNGSVLTRLAHALGFSPSTATLASDMKYLLDSGLMADSALVFGSGPGQVTLPCHRVVLAARSRYCRNMMAMSHRAHADGNGPASGRTELCVDDRVLPARVGRALLHCLYTDQVDLSLVGPATPATSSSSSSSAAQGGSTSSSSTHTTWPSVVALTARGSGPAARGATITKLDDAFTLYEIARFLELPIVVQGCEDAIVSLLSPRSVGHVLRWASCTQASRWVQRQAMRYLMDNFSACLSAPGSEGLPPAAVSAALANEGLQASEGDALKALLKWQEHCQRSKANEPNVVWHTAHSVTRRGKKKEVSDQQLRDGIAPLLPLLRLPLVPQDLAQQLVRRGILPPTSPSEQVDAWLGRSGHPPPRCYLPYLDQLKALLEDQEVPELELQRVRRARCVQPIPDTLYMVSSVGPSEPPPSIPARTVASLKARCLALSAAPVAQRALRLHTDSNAVYMQIALRAVREQSLPDSCASLVLPMGPIGGGGGLAGPSTSGPAPPDCCRPPSRALPPAPLPPPTSPPAPPLPDIALPPHPHHMAGVGNIPLPPNANTHLLTPREYYRPLPPPLSNPQPSPLDLPLLQLDLGDGATHTPRPGSRAGRAAVAVAVAAQAAVAERVSQRRELTHNQLNMSSHLTPARCTPARDDEMRANTQAIEMSLFRAYNSLQPNSSTLPLQHRHHPHIDSNHGPRSGVWPGPARRAHPSHAHPLRRDHTDCRMEPNVSSYPSSASNSRNPSPSNYQ